MHQCRIDRKLNAQFASQEYKINYFCLCYPHKYYQFTFSVRYSSCHLESVEKIARKTFTKRFGYRIFNWISWYWFNCHRISLQINLHFIFFLWFYCDFVWNNTLITFEKQTKQKQDSELITALKSILSKRYILFCRCIHSNHIFHDI